MSTLKTEIMVIASHLQEIIRTSDWSAFSLDDDRGEDGGMSTVIIIAGLVAAAFVIVGAIATMSETFASKLRGLSP